MTPTWITLDEWGFAAARYLLEALWQSTLVFAAVAALSALLRGHTPRVRRALWLSALLIAPALPVLSTLAKPAGLPQQSVAEFPVYAPPVFMPVEISREPESIAAPEIETPRAPVEQPKPSPADYPWALGLLAYALGGTFFFAWTLLGHFRIHQWMRSAREAVDPAIVEPFQRAAARLGVRRTVRVVLTERVPAPLTAGIVRPTVLLPHTVGDALTADDLYAVALHETVHIQQHEALVLTLASFVRSALYFHPLVWVACRRLAVLAEHTADDAVLEITGAPTAYAKLLTTFAERLPLRTPSTEGAAGLVFCKSAFLKRVEAILGDRKRIRKLTRIAFAGTVAAALVSLAAALALPLGSRVDDTRQEQRRDVADVTAVPPVPEGIDDFRMEAYAADIAAIEETSSDFARQNGKEALIDRFRKLLAAYPGFPKTVYIETQMADIWEWNLADRNERPDRAKAIEAYESILLRYKPAEPYMKQVMLLTANRCTELYPERARRLYESMPATYPADDQMRLESLYGLGHLAKLRGDIGEAERCLSLVMEYDPSSVRWEPTFTASRTQVILQNTTVELFWMGLGQSTLDPPAVTLASAQNMVARYPQVVLWDGWDGAFVYGEMSSLDDATKRADGLSSASNDRQALNLTERRRKDINGAEAAPRYVGFRLANRDFVPWEGLLTQVDYAGQRLRVLYRDTEEYNSFANLNPPLKEIFDSGARVIFSSGPTWYAIEHEQNKVRERNKVNSSPQYSLPEGASFWFQPGKTNTSSQRDARGETHTAGDLSPETRHSPVANAPALTSKTPTPVMSPNDSKTVGNDSQVQETAKSAENAPSTGAPDVASVAPGVPVKLPMHSPFSELSFRTRGLTNNKDSVLLEGGVECNLDETAIKSERAEFGKRGERFSFTGAVTLTAKDGGTVHADQCAIGEGSKARFAGNVSLDSGSTHCKTQSLVLDLQPGSFDPDKAITAPPRAPDASSAVDAANYKATSMSDSADRIVLEGRVEFDTDDFHATADRAQFKKDNPQAVTLSGNVVLAPKFEPTTTGKTTVRADHCEVDADGTARCTGAVTVESASGSATASLLVMQLRTGEIRMEGPGKGTTLNADDKGGEDADVKAVHANVVEGAIVMDRDLSLPLESGTMNPPAEPTRLRFSKQKDELLATAYLTVKSWPYARWRAHLELLDQNGKVVSNVMRYVQMPRFAVVASSPEVRELRFPTFPADQQGNARRFRFSMESVEVEQDGPFHINQNTDLHLNLDGTENANVIALHGFLVARSEKGYAATFHTWYLPSPGVSWIVSIILRDAQGKDVATGTTLIESIGASRMFVSRPERQIVEALAPITGDPGAIERAEQFTVRLVRADAANEVPPPTAKDEGAAPSALEKIVSLSMKNTTVADIAKELTRQTGQKIEVDPSAIAPVDGAKGGVKQFGLAVDGNVPYIDLKDVTLRQGLKAVLTPLGLYFGVTGETIWVSNSLVPGRLQGDLGTVDSESLRSSATQQETQATGSAEANTNVEFSTEVQVIAVRHSFGDAALHDLKPVAIAQRLEGDARIFLGPEVHVGDVVFGVSPEGGFPPRYADGANLSTAKKPPVELELLTAPRVTVGPLHADDSTSYKALLQDRDRTNASGLAGDADAKSVPETIPKGFLTKAFTPEFLQPTQSTDPDQIRLKPAVVTDFWTGGESKSKGARKMPPSGGESNDPYFGFSIGNAITYLKKTNELSVDFIFRTRDPLARGRLNGTPANDAKSKHEEIGFRYTFTCKPNDVVAFALPYRHEGHLIVAVSFERIGDPSHKAYVPPYDSISSTPANTTSSASEHAAKTSSQLTMAPQSGIPADDSTKIGRAAQDSLDKPVSLSMKNTTVADIVKELTRQTAQKIDINPSAIAPAVDAKGTASKSGEAVNGTLPYVDLKNVPLREALKAVLTPLKLDFAVVGDTITVGTPEKLHDGRSEATITSSPKAAGTTEETAYWAEEVAPGYSREKIKGMSFSDVEDLGAAFQALYSANTARSVNVKGGAIAAEEYKLSKPEEIAKCWGSKLPDGILVLKGENQRSALPMAWAPYAERRAYITGTAPDAVLCVEDGSGGNGWNATPYHIVSLEESSYLKRLGKVSSVTASDGARKLDLSALDSVWESNVPWCGHAHAPGARIYYRVTNARLEPDTERNRAYWKSEIEKRNSELAILRKDMKKEPNAEVHPPDSAMANDSSPWMPKVILEKYLLQRLLTGHEKAWAGLQADLRYLDATDFYFAARRDGKNVTDKYPIEKMEAALTAGLATWHDQPWVGESPALEAPPSGAATISPALKAPPLGQSANPAQFIRVAGKIKDENGKPVPSAMVYLSTGNVDKTNPAALDYSQPEMLKRARVYETNSDPDGSFTFEEVRHMGFARMSVVAHGYAGNERTIELRAGQALADREVVLKPGRVLGGTLLSAGSAPVSDAVVSILYSDDRNSLGGFAVTDAQGRFELGFAATTHWADLRAVSDTQGEEYFVKFPIGNKDLTLRMHPKAVLRGTVTWPDGSPATGASVAVRTIFSDHDGPMSGWPYMVGKRTKVGADGAYSLPDLFPGVRHEVMVTEDEPGRDPSACRPLAPWMYPYLVLAPGETKEQNVVAMHGRLRNDLDFKLFGREAYKSLEYVLFPLDDPAPLNESTPTTPEEQNADGRRQKDRNIVEKALEQTVNLSVKATHISEVVDSLEKQTGAKIGIDCRMIEPPKGVAKDREVGDYASDGVISNVELSNVTLRAALLAILRPMKLDCFTFEDNICISSADRVAAIREATGPSAKATDEPKSVDELLGKQLAYFQRLKSIQYAVTETFSSTLPRKGEAESNTEDYVRHSTFVQEGKRYYGTGRVKHGKGTEQVCEYGSSDGKTKYPEYVLPFTSWALAPETMSAHLNFDAAQTLGTKAGWDYVRANARLAGAETQNGLACAVLRIEKPGNAGSPKGYSLVYFAKDFDYFPIASKYFQESPSGATLGCEEEVSGLAWTKNAANEPYVVYKTFASRRHGPDGAGLRQEYTFDTATFKINEPIPEAAFTASVPVASSVPASEVARVLDRRVTVSWSDGTLGDVANALAAATKIGIVLDNSSTDASAIVKGASFENQPVKSVLDALSKPLALRYIVQKNFIWLSAAGSNESSPTG